MKRRKGRSKLYYTVACCESPNTCLDKVRMYWCAKFDYIYHTPGHAAQLVTCLATDASLTAYSGVASSISARSHIISEIGHSPSAESFKKDCCQLQAKVCARSTG